MINNWITEYKVGQSVIVNFGDASDIKPELRNKELLGVIEHVEVNVIPGGPNSIWSGVYVEDTYGNEAYCDVQYLVRIGDYKNVYMSEYCILRLAQ